LNIIKKEGIKMADIKSKNSFTELLKLFFNVLIVLTAMALDSALAFDSDFLLTQYDTSGRKFERREIGDKTVYFHQRMIGNAIVENDFIVYKFDSSTHKLLSKNVHWRSDLSEQGMYLTPSLSLINREEAESTVEGDVEFSDLYIISPDSDAYPIEPTPENPCWVVRSTVDGMSTVTIIDAVTGEKLGNGVPPPTPQGFSFSGNVKWGTCDGAWTSWYTNAREWFETMGYPTEALKWPKKETVKEHIQGTETVMFYELAHGTSMSFTSGCSTGNYFDTIYAVEVSEWISNYPKMPFTFLGSCGGMCDTGTNTFSHEFRKGSKEDTATVGYCDMSNSPCSSCWVNSVRWQDALFRYMSEGDTVKEAFDKALTDYPMCAPLNDRPCMRFAGDENFAVVPVVTRTGEPNPDPDPNPNPSLIDSRISLRVRTAQSSPRFDIISPVSLDDRFEDKDFTIFKPMHIYSAADINDQGVLDLDTYLVSYLIKEVKKSCSDDAPQNQLRSCTIEEDCGGITRQTRYCQKTPPFEKLTTIKVKNQLGEIFVDNLKPNLLLVPSAMDLNISVSPLSPVDSDYYKCYIVTESKGTGRFERQQVSVLDQFIEDQIGTAKVFDVIRPTKLCTPVTLNVFGTPNPIINPEENLMCYIVRPSFAQDKHDRVSNLHTNNKLGPLELDTIREEELCLPSQITFTP
jgi:hypothetical protein